jgi:HPt (histidine-containing phosphotransfer) domain-containing protein
MGNSMGIGLFRAYLLAQAAATLPLFFTPQNSWVHVALRVLGGWMAAAFVLVGMRRHRPAGAAAYYLFGLAVFLNVTGTMVERLLSTWSPDLDPPSWADLFWLMIYPALVVGMSLLIRRRGRGGDRDRATLIDSTIIIVGLGLLSWVFLIRPQATHQETTLAGRATLTAYPLGDLLVLALMVRLLVGGGSRALSFRLMIGALLSLLASDMVWAIFAQIGYDPSSAVQRLLAVNYQLAYTLVGAAALHPSVQEVARPAPRDARLSPLLLVGLAAASLIAPGLLMYQIARNNIIDGVAIALSSAVLFLLVVVRMAELLGRIEDRTRELAERNRSVRLVLDTVNEGLLRVARDGRLVEERSLMIDRWFGPFTGGIPFADYIGRADESFAESFRLGLEAWVEGFLPAELCLEQLPRRLQAGGRNFTVDYLPVADGPSAEGLLLVITDVTEARRLARQEAEQRELLAVSHGLARNRANLFALFDEVAGMLEQVGSGAADLPTRLRLLHTIKGNTALAGLDLVAQLCHTAEAELEEGAGSTDAPALAALRARWQLLTEALRDLAGQRRPDAVEVPKRDLEALAEELAQGLPPAQAALRLRSWRCEPVARPLERLAGHARALAGRLGKGDLALIIDAGDLHLDAERWRPLWSELVHVVNNAVDHGLEAPAQRQAAGKPEQPRLRLAARLQQDALVIEVEDDGRGIDWEAIKRAAAPLGLPVETSGDLTAALLAAGVSSRADVSLVSGRGVGMSAVAASARELRGEISITSRPGAGTCVRLSFPLSALAPHEGEAAPAQRRTRVA